MERILSASEMRLADEHAVSNFGILPETLIERAGVAVSEEIIKSLKGGRVLVCVGKGNNGEDGKIVAKILSATHGFTVSTLCVANGLFKLFEKKFDIIVDCIFGTGLNREVEGRYRTAIELINSSGAYVVSCDIPSGLCADSGKVLGVSVKANLTVAIQEYKLGHFLNDGPDYCGKVIAKDIGISVWGEDYATRLTAESVKKYFLARKRNANKGSFKKAAVVGGSKSFTGSAMLSANALSVLKMGVGYTYLFVPESLFSVYAGVNPECIISVLPDSDGNFVFDEKSLTALLSFPAISFGMGVGVSEQTYKIARFLLQNYSGRLLIDADGLNSIAKFGIDVLKNKKCEVVLTPHVGEFARLANKSIEEVLNQPIDCAKKFAKEFGCVLLLKNAVSIITDGDKVILNTTGNSALAKAGSGDVLSGLSVGILSRGEELLESVAVSSYIFGLSGEKAVGKFNEYTVTASEVIACIPEAINSL